MREEFDLKLVEKYPKIFVNRYGDPKETLMCWGFDIGDGWYNMIDLLCWMIQNHCDNNPDVQQVVAVQVKEKFGGLRFYVDGGDDTINNWIQFAENLSNRTCEVCGAPGRMRGKGWYFTACVDHARGQLLDDENIGVV